MTAGFGSSSSETLSRIYLDLHAWSRRYTWKLELLSEDEGAEGDAGSSNSKTAPVSAAGTSMQNSQTAGTTAAAGNVSVSNRWDPYTVIQPWLARLDMIWLVVPLAAYPVEVGPNVEGP